VDSLASPSKNLFIFPPYAIMAIFHQDKRVRVFPAAQFLYGPSTSTAPQAVVQVPLPIVKPFLAIFANRHGEFVNDGFYPVLVFGAHRDN
jgi:hypothetical protein